MASRCFCNIFFWSGSVIFIGRQQAGEDDFGYTDAGFWILILCVHVIVFYADGDDQCKVEMKAQVTYEP
jgi:hypothetical protein